MDFCSSKWRLEGYWIIGTSTSCSSDNIQTHQFFVFLCQQFLFSISLTSPLKNTGIAPFYAPSCVSCHRWSSQLPLADFLRELKAMNTSRPLRTGGSLGYLGCFTLPETNGLHLKMDGWNTSFLLEFPIFTLICGRFPF